MRHVVLLRWTDDADAVGVASAIDRMRAIPYVVALDAGENVSPEGLGAGFDYGFVVTFASASDRDRYLADPAHLRVAETIGAATSEVLVFDIG